MGLISFTADIWSSKGLRPFLALTAHWLGRKGESDQIILRQTLLAFRRIRGAHSGQRLARIVFDILEHAGIERKVSQKNGFHWRTCHLLPGWSHNDG